MMREKVIRPLPGLLALTVLLGAVAATIWLFAQAAHANVPRSLALPVTLLLLEAISTGGFVVVQPNESSVLTLFGRYSGTVKDAGFWWVNPFNKKHRLSLRVRNFETAKLKVNDANGNPIEIGAIVVWRVTDTAEAMFEVDDYEERLAKAGVEVREARISHLAYSPEIAQAMLQRQQASAIIAARYKIVEGAVGMVENALELLAQKKMLTLDDERKAAMVSNLLVVLCGERGTQPVLNTGTLYT